MKIKLEIHLKSLLIFSFIVLGPLFLGLSLALIKPASAQIPPGQQECDETASPEFHTFRPYQADPCNQNYQDLALFCGNDLIISDNITVTRYGSGYLLYCQRFSPTEEQCFYRVPRILDLAIDVSGAEFPIMGNTEGIENNRGIINSQDQTIPEQIDDAEKVNEYVSWYLNGVTNAPEYGALDANNPEDLFKIVNLTGPIKRLLPHRKLRDVIQENIESAGSSRHDQVVGCHSGGQITDCYIEGGTEIRLGDYSGDRLPPQEEDFPDFNGWWVAYQQWRGYECIRIPLTDNFFCTDVPWRPNYWADLFFQIPESSTEDRKGLIEVVNPAVQPASPNLTITVNSLITTPADLFFAHQEESQKLADILQSTFTPAGQPKSGPVRGVSPAEYCDLTQVRSNPGDDLFAGEIGVNVDYTAEFSCAFDFSEPPDPIDTYNCDTYIVGRCYTDDWDCDYWASNTTFFCPSGYRCGRGCDYDPPNQSCSVTAQVVLNTITETPLTDDIWSRLVAGPMGVFKRIFPKVESGAPIEGILDIPGATGVNFNLVNPPAGVSLYAGNPSNQRSALELYFPHVGGIHEYFLKCIQQALRPEGFGEGCLSGAPGTQPADVMCDPTVPESEIPSEYRGGFRDNFLRLANIWSERCPGPENNLAEECYNDTVKQSADAGVNPGFALTIWLNESGASNYCEGGATTKDFGIYDASIAQNWGEQLERFLALPSSGTYAYCRSQAGWIEPMHSFLNVFRLGDCDTITSVCNPSDNNTTSNGPTAGTCYYYKIRDFTWPLVTEPVGGCLSGGLFAINWPTDNNCP